MDVSSVVAWIWENGTAIAAIGIAALVIDAAISIWRRLRGTVE